DNERRSLLWGISAAQLSAHRFAVGPPATLSDAVTAHAHPPAVPAASSTRLCTVLLAIVVIALAVSAVQPYDRLTWLLEVLPVLIAVPLLVATHRRFPLTPLVCVLVT